MNGIPFLLFKLVNANKSYSSYTADGLFVNLYLKL